MYGKERIEGKGTEGELLDLEVGGRDKVLIAMCGFLGLVLVFGFDLSKVE